MLIVFLLCHSLGGNTHFHPHAMPSQAGAHALGSLPHGVDDLSHDAGDRNAAPSHHAGLTSGHSASHSVQTWASAEPRDSALPELVAAVLVLCLSLFLAGLQATDQRQRWPAPQPPALSGLDRYHRPPGRAPPLFHS